MSDSVLHCPNNDGIVSVLDTTWSMVPYTVHGILATADIHMSVVTGLHLHGTVLISQWA